MNSLYVLIPYDLKTWYKLMAYEYYLLKRRLRKGCLFMLGWYRYYVLKQYVWRSAVYYTLAPSIRPTLRTNLRRVRGPRFAKKSPLPQFLSFTWPFPCLLQISVWKYLLLRMKFGHHCKLPWLHELRPSRVLCILLGDRLFACWAPVRRDLFEVKDHFWLTTLLLAPANPTHGRTSLLFVEQMHVSHSLLHGKLSITPQ